MNWMIVPLKRYLDFSGRSPRIEYWMFQLFYILSLIVLVLVFPEDTAVILASIFLIGTFLPMLAVSIRRFHDQDRSGWFILLSFIPVVGGIILIVFMCLPGTPGNNTYGPPYEAPGVPTER